jgi:cyclic pyranopterin monophosphate synthase
MPELSHFDDSGSSRMVDVGAKPITMRVAVASGQVTMQRTTWELIRDRKTTKGDVREVARLAGIMAAKQTANLIPLCHPLPLDSVEIEFVEPADPMAELVALGIRATVRVTARTGVEMEALTAVSVAALTIYDMCKAVDRAMVLGQIRLEQKSGGKSGDYSR